MRENILVLVMDSVRYDLSEKGLRKIEDVVERYGGRKYTECRAPSIWSLPSHVSMLTGIPTYKHGVVSSEDKLSEKFETVMSNTKRDSAVFGSNPYLNGDEFGLNNQFDENFTEKPLIFSENSVMHILNVLRKRFSTSHSSDKIIDWCSERENSWVAFGTFMDTHSPYIPEKYNNSSILNTLKESNVQYTDGFDRDLSDVITMKKLQIDCIESIESRIISVINSLDNKDILDNTRVIITSDHGEGFKEDNIVGDSDAIFHYNSLNSELLHVPLYEIIPNADSYKTVNKLASLTKLPEVISGKSNSFTVDKAQSSVFFGGNQEDMQEPYFGKWGKVVYIDREKTVDKFVEDPRGVWTNKQETSEEEVLSKINTVFNRKPKQIVSESTKITEDVKENLEGLGYM